MILTTGMDGGGPDTLFVGGGGWIDGILDPPGLGPEFPAWSPDGEWIAFRGKFSLPGDSVWDRQRRLGIDRRSAREQIFIVRRDGSALRQLTDDAYHNTGPDWSPDGRRVVFQSEREEGSDLFVVDTAGSHARRLTDRPGPDSSADWSPDGD
jgi:TolB protein